MSLPQVEVTQPEWMSKYVSLLSSAVTASVYRAGTANTQMGSTYSSISNLVCVNVLAVCQSNSSTDRSWSKPSEGNPLLFPNNSTMSCAGLSPEVGFVETSEVQQSWKDMERSYWRINTSRGQEWWISCPGPVIGFANRTNCINTQDWLFLGLERLFLAVYMSLHILQINTAISQRTEPSFPDITGEQKIIKKSSKSLWSIW